MTLAALSPLFIWWPLTLIGLILVATIARRVAELQRLRNERPWPPPIVLALPAPVFPWPPPRVA